MLDFASHETLEDPGLFVMPADGVDDYVAKLLHEQSVAFTRRRIAPRTKPYAALSLDQARRRAAALREDWGRKAAFSAFMLRVPEAEMFSQVKRLIEVPFDMDWLRYLDELELSCNADLRAHGEGFTARPIEKDAVVRELMQFEEEHPGSPLLPDAEFLAHFYEMRVPTDEEYERWFDGLFRRPQDPRR